MKKLIAALTVGVALALSPGVAHAQSTPKEIRVAGSTEWLETYQVIDELKNKWGIPISAYLCRPNEQYCITIKHTREASGWAGLAVGTTGKATITLNSYYGNTSAYRKALLYHELGHALGLWDHSDCSSSMSTPLAACGYYVLGYNASEYQRLHQIWG